MIEKLGITPGPLVITGAKKNMIATTLTDDYRSILFESWSATDNDLKLFAAAHDMLEALIKSVISDYKLAESGDCGQYDAYEQSDTLRKIGTIEKATRKTWEEVKTILESEK